METYTIQETRSTRSKDRNLVDDTIDYKKQIRDIQAIFKM